MTHSPDCLAQNVNTLFGEPKCICDPKWLKKQAKAAKPVKVLNPCHGAAVTKVAAPTEHYLVRKLFKPSTKQLAAYAATQKHKVPQKRTEDSETGDIIERDTFDDEAVSTLRLTYPKDRVYPYIADYRTLQKAEGNYFAKMAPESLLVGADGRLRDEFRHSPATLRLAMELLQVVPRPLDKDEDAILPPNAPDRILAEARKCFVPTRGHTFTALDFMGIEPLLVAYFMRHTDYLRACRLNSHSYVTAFVVGHPVDMSMSDADVTAHFADLKARDAFVVNKRPVGWSAARVACKKVHMTSLYAGGPGEIARSTPSLFPKVADARYLQDMLHELIPLKQWHMDVAREAWEVGYLRCPSGFRLHAGMPLTNKWDPKTRTETYRLNRESKSLIASRPQHTGMMYTATATLALERERPDLAQWLRLLVHDEIFGEPPVELAEEFVRVLGDIMQRPHPLMPLWPEASAVMGGDTHLRVGVDSKMSTENWGSMR